ncbi:PRE C2HC domain-containing protein, partial [Aphis craccivora]
IVVVGDLWTVDIKLFVIFINNSTITDNNIIESDDQVDVSSKGKLNNTNKDNVDPNSFSWNIVLKDNNAYYHTYQLQSDKLKRVVIMNLHLSTPEEDIVSAIEEIGNIARNFTNVKF